MAFRLFGYLRDLRSLRCRRMLVERLSSVWRSIASLALSVSPADSASLIFLCKLLHILSKARIATDVRISSCSSRGRRRRCERAGYPPGGQLPPSEWLKPCPPSPRPGLSRPGFCPRGGAQGASWRRGLSGQRGQSWQGLRQKIPR